MEAPNFWISVKGSIQRITVFWWSRQSYFAFVRRLKIDACLFNLFLETVTLIPIWIWCFFFHSVNCFHLKNCSLSNSFKREIHFPVIVYFLNSGRVYFKQSTFLAETPDLINFLGKQTARSVAYANYLVNVWFTCVTVSIPAWIMAILQSKWAHERLNREGERGTGNWISARVWCYRSRHRTISWLVIFDWLVIYAR